MDRRYDENSLRNMICKRPWALPDHLEEFLFSPSWNWPDFLLCFTTAYLGAGVRKERGHCLVKICSMACSEGIPSRAKTVTRSKPRQTPGHVVVLLYDSHIYITAI